MSEDVARPTRDDDREEWKVYWAAQGMPWRSEPEIGVERQRFLASRRAQSESTEMQSVDLFERNRLQGSQSEANYFPFYDYQESRRIKLSRADVEWLLATHKTEIPDIIGPVNVSDPHQKTRKGIDLTGADLSSIDLSELPLDRIKGGFNEEDLSAANGEIDNDARERYLCLNQAVLTGANLRQSELGGVSFQGALIRDTKLQGAMLTHADLRQSYILETQLQDAQLQGAQLDNASLVIDDEDEDGRPLLRPSHLEGVLLMGASLHDTDLREAHLEGANLGRAQLQGANLTGAHLERANLREARLEGATFVRAHIAGADLRLAFLDRATDLSDAVINDIKHGCVLVADARWGDANLAVVDWGERPHLGDEREARAWRPGALLEPSWMKPLTQQEREAWLRHQQSAHLDRYRAATRANRQLATVLRVQGLSDEADRFAYRAQMLQRKVFWLQRAWGRAFFSGLLDLVAGYGYRPWRSVITYVVTIAVFAFLYWCVTNDVSLTHGLFTQAITGLGMAPPPPSHDHLQGYEAVVVSMTSFHGRGFFQPIQSPGDRVAILAAIEAAIGLLIEITFIATFTQRFFAR